jgi:broad specificity phosphatase PhoE
MPDAPWSMPPMPPLWLVRHGESAGNVARDRAEATGAALIEIEGRDVDVPLSELGERQARAVGRWFARLPAAERPTRILTSPYARAATTADLIGEALGDVRCARDERLREKELGSLNRLTRAGVLARYPHEAEQRALIGKFYYRPPGGESWCDVVLRLRAVFDHLQLTCSGERIAIVAHQVIILCARYILEELSEAQLLEIDAAGELANCSLTTYTRRGRGLALAGYNVVEPLDEAGAPVTAAPDAPGRQA